MLTNVVLIQPHIPWNTGNIGRTCLGFGARLFLVDPKFSVDSKTLRRAGLDYWDKVAFSVHSDLDDFMNHKLTELPNKHFFSRFASKSIYKTQFFTEKTNKSFLTSTSRVTIEGEEEDHGIENKIPSLLSVTLVFGSEPNGFSVLEKNHKDKIFPKVRIPTLNDCGIRSLNLSTSVGIAIFEAQRQRNLLSGKEE